MADTPNALEALKLAREALAGTYSPQAYKAAIAAIDAVPSQPAEAMGVELPKPAGLGRDWNLNEDFYFADQVLSYGNDRATEALSQSSARAGKDAADAERLDWLLAHPNEVLEDAGNEWFILDTDSEPTYFKSSREAIDAARAALSAATKDTQ